METYMLLRVSLVNQFPRVAFMVEFQLLEG